MENPRVIRRALACTPGLLCIAAAVWAAPPGFAFLEVPAGARASAMGGAYASVAEGVDAAFWNPAGLAGVKGTQVSATHVEFFQGLRHDQFAVAGRLLGGGASASLRAMYSEPIPERDDIGNLLGTFGAHDLEFQLAYGWDAGGGRRTGVGLQAVRERIANAAVTTWSASVGGSWQPARWPDTRLSLSAHNLGPASHYDIDGVRGAPVELPMSVQAGASWHHPLASGLDIVSALETRATRGRQAVVALGGELGTPVGAALRLGIRGGDDASMFSAGVGYTRGTLRVDYAWVPTRLDLGDTHRFSIGAQF